MPNLPHPDPHLTCAPPRPEWTAVTRTESRRYLRYLRRIVIMAVKLAALRQQLGLLLPPHETCARGVATKVALGTSGRQAVPPASSASSEPTTRRPQCM